MATKLKGQKRGVFTVLDILPKQKGESTRYKVKCSLCNNIKDIHFRYLYSKDCRSCGSLKKNIHQKFLENLARKKKETELRKKQREARYLSRVGMKFGKTTVIKYITPGQYISQCSCGKFLKGKWQRIKNAKRCQQCFGRESMNAKGIFIFSSKGERLNLSECARMLGISRERARQLKNNNQLQVRIDHICQT